MNSNIGLFSRVCVHFACVCSRLIKPLFVSVVLLSSMAFGVVYASDVSAVDQKETFPDVGKSGLVAANDNNNGKGKGKGKGKGSTTTTTLPNASDGDDDHGKGKGKGKGK